MKNLTDIKSQQLPNIEKDIAFLASIDQFSLSSFLKCLHAILLIESPDAIGWCEAGKFLEIRDFEYLESQILPCYFRHNKLASFIRQLHYFGFKKKNPSSYGRNYFARNKPEDLLRINKKRSSKVGQFGSKRKKYQWFNSQHCKRTGKDSRCNIIDINDLSSFYNELAEKFVCYPGEAMEKEVLQLLLDCEESKKCFKHNENTHHC